MSGFLFKTGMRKGNAVAAIMSIVLLAVGCASHPTVSQPQVWGRADAKEVDVNTKVPGRVTALLVKEGDVVQQGQLLARIDVRDIVAKSDQAKAAIAALQAQQSAAGTETALADQGTRAKVDAMASQVEKAKVALDLARKNYDRFKELADQGAIPKQTLDVYETQYQAALTDLTNAQSGLAGAQAEVLQTQMSRDKERAVQNQIEQAQAQLDEVNVYIQEADIYAPLAGVVTAKNVEVGEMVSTGTPLLTIQDPTDNWVNLKVKETDLHHYQLHSTVQLEGRDPGLKLQGTIEDISKKPEFATYRAVNERDDVDIITFNVKIRVNSDQIRPGMRFRVVNGRQ